MGERVAAVEEWQTGHEKSCLERLTTINTSIKGVETKVDKVTDRLDALVKALAMAILAFAGWAAVQLYTIQTTHGPGASVSASVALRP
jgi:ribosomal protein L1